MHFVRHLNWVTLKKMVIFAAQRRLTGLAAEMAYHEMLGLFPAIIAILTAISIFEQSVESNLGVLAIRLADIVPQQVWNLLLDFTHKVKVAEEKSWFSLSFIAAIWIFSGVLSAAMNALDQIHQVAPKERRPFWQAKIIAILLTIGTIILLIIASFLLVVGDFLLQIAIRQNWGELLLIVWKIFTVIVVIAILGLTISFIYQIDLKLKQENVEKDDPPLISALIVFSAILIQLVHSLFIFVRGLIVNADIEQKVIYLLLSVWRLLSLPVALGIIAIAFAFIYRFGTSRRQSTNLIMPGAILAAISWAIVSGAFRLYVSHFGQYHKIYGAVGVIIVLMLWLYLSSLVMLLGDQLNVIVGEAMAASTKLKSNKQQDIPKNKLGKMRRKDGRGSP